MTSLAEPKPEASSRARRPLARNLPWLLGILFATLAFWKLRIIDTGVKLAVTLGSYDIYTEHYPMAKWGFGRLFAGDFPHWNPYQLTGLPFQAIPYVGLLYPANWIYGVFETAAATELSFIAHLFFAGAMAFLLGRTLALSPLASLVTSLTFMWSGWMMQYANQASLISGMSWLPATVLLVELSLRGRRWAAFGLVAAVAFQLLNGATEFFVHNMYVAGGYTLMRLGQRVLAGEWRDALWYGALLLGCVACGVGLAAPQLLPSIEMAAESTRGATRLSIAQTRTMGTVPPALFLQGALMTHGMVTVGALPLAGVFLGASSRRRDIWLFAWVLVAVSALLVFGGLLYELYYATPIGALFRRPHKFLHVYAFGQALMAGLAVMALQTWRDAPRRAIWLRPAFLACLAVLGAAALFLLSGGQRPIALLGLLVALLCFALVDSGRLRTGIVAAVVLLQATNLFFGVKQEFVRPASALESFHSYDRLLAQLKEISHRSGGQRAYLAPDVFLQPGLMQKSGMLHGIPTFGDYAPLATQRSADFFRAISPPTGRGVFSPFDGSVYLGADSDWGLVDLTSTRFFVVRGAVPAGEYLAAEARRAGSGVRLRFRGMPRVYERTRALPRAYFVPKAQLADGPEEAMSLLRADGFAPRRSVVLEGAPASLAEYGGGKRARAEVALIDDESERVAVTVRTRAPGFVVLTDAYHPDWEASSETGELPVYRANYLFRAVPVEPGYTRIEMRYRPRAFRVGLWVCGVTLLAMTGAAIVQRRMDGRAASPGR